MTGPAPNCRPWTRTRGSTPQGCRCLSLAGPLAQAQKRRVPGPQTWWKTWPNSCGSVLLGPLEGHENDHLARGRCERLRPCAADREADRQRVALDFEDTRRRHSKGLIIIIALVSRSEVDFRRVLVVINRVGVFFFG